MRRRIDARRTDPRFVAAALGALAIIATFPARTLALQMELSADHLWYDFGILGTRGHTFALQYGLGGRARFEEREDDRLGLRAPVGLTWFVSGGRVGLFMEVAPVLDVVPATQLDVQGGLGARCFLR